VGESTLAAMKAESLIGGCGGRFFGLVVTTITTTTIA